MQLADAAARESGVDPEHIMLLRHANGKVASLLRAGASIEEYTLVQPTDSKYDFRAFGKTPIEVVAVVVNDHVYGLYKITGVERTGTTHSLTSAAFRAFDTAMGYPIRAAKRFSGHQLSCTFKGKAVSGWSSPRNAVARFGGKLFQEVIKGAWLDCLSARNVDPGPFSLHQAISAYTTALLQ